MADACFNALGASGLAFDRAAAGGGRLLMADGANQRVREIRGLEPSQGASAALEGASPAGSLEHQLAGAPRAPCS